MDSLFLTLAFEGHLPPWIAVLVIARDLLIVAGHPGAALPRRRAFASSRCCSARSPPSCRSSSAAPCCCSCLCCPACWSVIQPLVVVTAVSVLASAAAYVQSAARIWVLRTRAAVTRRAVVRGRAACPARRASLCWTCRTPTATGSPISCPPPPTARRSTPCWAGRLAGACLPADRARRLRQEPSGQDLGASAPVRVVLRGSELWEPAEPLRQARHAPPASSTMPTRRRRRCSCSISGIGWPSAAAACCSPRDRPSPAGTCACPTCARGC